MKAIHSPTRSQAVKILTERHALMTQHYPAGMVKVPLALYIRRNLTGLMRLDADAQDELDRANHDLYSL